jgi:hypothetical protein
VHEYSVQVFLILESLVKFSSDNVEVNETFIGGVVSLLQGMMLVESPQFVNQHLRKSLLPRFKDRLSHSLIQIFEELMQEVPIELLSSPSRMADHEPTPLKSILRPIDSVASYCSSDQGSVPSMKR